MKFWADKRLKRGRRRAKPVAGRSLSTNSYYRPVSDKSLERSRKKDEARSGSFVPNIKKSSKSLLTGFGTAKVVNGLIVAVFVFLAVSATTLSAVPHLKLEAEVNLFRDRQEYSFKAHQILGSNFLYRSKLFFRSSEYEARMRQEFPEIEDIEAIVPLVGRDLNVMVSLSRPLAKVFNGQDSGIVDSNGLLTAINSSEAVPDPLIKMVLGAEQDNFQVGSRLLTESEISLLKLLVANNIRVKEVLFHIDIGQFEVSLIDAAYKIRLSTHADPAEQVGAFRATISQLTKTNQLPQEYIDVRVPGRVFVK